MNSIAHLDACAGRHLANYVNPNGGRAFASYDREGDRGRFLPVDALAPALLDAPVKGALVIELFAEQRTSYTDLRLAMQRLLDETIDPEPLFGDVDLEDEQGPWGLVREVLRCSDRTKGLKASKVTKMLHRKRPNLVPIFDSQVTAFYGTTARTPWVLWPLLQQDLRDRQGLLRDLVSGIRTPDGRALSHLRGLDIVVWEHQVTGCGRAN